MSIEQLMHDAALARLNEQTLEERWQQEFRSFQEKHSGLRDGLDAAKMARQNVETELRDAILEAYSQNGEKKFPGGGVRIIKSLEYKDADALFWAQQHSMALALDRKAFERLAKAGDVSATIVTVTEEPQATINTDLSRFLEKVTT